LALLVVPGVALLARVDRESLADQLTSSEVQSATWLSLRTTLMSLCVVLVLGTPLALLLARAKFRGKWILETLTEIPAVLPPSAAGLALLLAFGREGLVGKPLGISFAFTTIAVVVAQVFVATPVYVRAASNALAGVDAELADAAVLDGATRWGVLRWVTFPIVRESLIAAAALAWARALGEFGATILFAGNLPDRTQTLPLALYLGFEQDLEKAIAIAAVLLGMAIAVLLVVRLIASRART